MGLALRDDWRAAFALAADAEAAKRYKERMKHYYEDIDREKETEHRYHERVEKEHHEAEEALATPAQIAEFTTHLEQVDTSIVERLMANRKALDEVRDDLKRMHEDAYVLPDGRHVYRTADGRKVFDESGAEVARDIIDPAAIPNNRPSWDAVTTKRSVEGSRVAEQDCLYEAETKVAAAQQHAKRGKMTTGEINDMTKDLDATMSRAALYRVRAEQAGADLSTGGKQRPDDVQPGSLAATLDDTMRPAQRQPQPAPY